jgi:hypothetical protein
LYVQKRLGPKDTVIVAGGPVAVAIGHHYIGRVDYALSNRPSVETLKWSGGKLVDVYVGSEIISVTFALTDDSFRVLESKEVPARVLKKLQGIKDREFSGEPIFLNVLRNTLGIEEAFEHKTAIMNSAVIRDPDQCCRIKQLVENHSEGAVWLVGNWNSLVTDDRDYPDCSKEYLRSLIQKPDYWGLDGRTFAVKISDPRNAVAEQARLTDKR